MTQQVFEDLESNKYQFAEYRLSIYGAKRDEWNALSEWVVDHKLFSSNVRWMIQVPRLYSIYKASGQIKNFAEMLRSQSTTKKGAPLRCPRPCAVPFLRLTCFFFCLFPLLPRSLQTSSLLFST